MGRPPSNGAPSFRFNATEVAEMEEILKAHKNAVPTREVLVSLSEKFSASPERSGKVQVQMKQVWNWFQNRRYALRAKAGKSPGKLSVSPMHRDDPATVTNLAQPPQTLPAPSATVKSVSQAPHAVAAPSVQNVGRTVTDNSHMEFEAKSARDGAWYDVAVFLSHRYLETGDPEVLVRFSGFGPEEDEWVNVRRHVRQRSLPCESSECVAVLPGDLILCFQEGKEQALYFDAHVLDAQRRRHDVRGCRCRFLVRYDHDQSEEIVPLRKVCRRPVTDYRLQQLHAVNDSSKGNQHKTGADPYTTKPNPLAESPQKRLRVEESAVSALTLPPAASASGAAAAAPPPVDGGAAPHTGGSQSASGPLESPQKQHEVDKTSIAVSTAPPATHSSGGAPHTGGHSGANPPVEAPQMEVDAEPTLLSVAHSGGATPPGGATQMEVDETSNAASALSPPAVHGGGADHCSGGNSGANPPAEPRELQHQVEEVPPATQSGGDDPLRGGITRTASPAEAQQKTGEGADAGGGAPHSGSSPVANPTAEAPEKQKEVEEVPPAAHADDADAHSGSCPVNNPPAEVPEKQQVEELPPAPHAGDGDVHTGGSPVANPPAEAPEKQQKVEEMLPSVDGGGGGDPQTGGIHPLSEASEKQKEVEEVPPASHARGGDSDTGGTPVANPSVEAPEKQQEVQPATHSDGGNPHTNSTPVANSLAEPPQKQQVEEEMLPAATATGGGSTEDMVEG